MSRTGAEAKPPWSAVPRAIKDEVAALLGSPVARAERVYGGYAPSATFRVLLRDGRRAFLKGTYPLTKDSGVKWDLENEERIYQECAPFMRPWAPEYFGGAKADGWHVIVLEDVGPQTMPPWTRAKAAACARSYAAFHAHTYGKPLPRWLSRIEHHDFAPFWARLGATGELRGTASLAKRRADEAEEWLDVALPVFREKAALLMTLRPPFAFMHFDTRSDNIRLQGKLLRLFDWNFACAGPIEFDVAAFAQSIVMEGGPEPERIVAEYDLVLPLRPAALDASIAGIAGYLADRAWRPPVPGLPRIRSVQRRQLKATLAWATRHFGLPEPRWLVAVAD
ncbi:MAG TPA: phosphotransferase [Candidatus Saccharimonadales bacterium]|nr:phosphotransferase [Candidatus Saccharimonadales bacterium]